MSKHNHETHNHNQDHPEDDGKMMTIKEYNKTNLLIFTIKHLYTTGTSICTLTSIDRISFLANSVEHHECKTSELNEYFTELVKRNLIAHFFDKIEIEPFDALDAKNQVDFLFE